MWFAGHGLQFPTFFKGLSLTLASLVVELRTFEFEGCEFSHSPAMPVWHFVTNLSLRDMDSNHD